LHRLRGTYQPVRHDKRAVEPVTTGELGEVGPPEWMTESQRAIWQDILKRVPKGILRAIDAELFAAYCELVDCHQQVVQAQAAMNAKSEAPFLIRSASGVVLSPYVRIRNQTVLLMARLASEMGFSPTSRAALGTPREPNAPSDGDGTWGELKRFPVVTGKK